jgi:transposase
MQTECTKVQFIGQDVYVGLDVAKKSWKVCIYLGGAYHKRFSQPPEPGVLVDYLHRNFPGATYHSVYEAGYFGFWIHRELVRLGVHSIVINPADVPTTDKERRTKTDRVDAAKLARALANRELTPIYVPERAAEEDRTLIRMRAAFVRKQTRTKNQIKALLQVYGYRLPQDIAERHWTRAYIRWLESLTFEQEAGRAGFQALLNELLTLRATIADLTNQKRSRFLSGALIRRVRMKHLASHQRKETCMNTRKVAQNSGKGKSFRLESFDHFLALDWSMKIMAVARMTRQRKQAQILERPSDLKKLKMYLDSLKGRKVLAIEETTTAQWPYLELIDHVDHLIVCDPYRNRLLSDGPKTDRIDAGKLCMLLRAGLLKEVYHSSSDLYELRRLVSAYGDLIQAGVRTLNQKFALEQGHRDTGKQAPFILEHMNKSIDLYRSTKEQYEHKF